MHPRSQAIYQDVYRALLILLIDDSKADWKVCRRLADEEARAAAAAFERAYPEAGFTASGAASNGSRVWTGKEIGPMEVAGGDAPAPVTHAFKAGDEAMFDGRRIKLIAFLDNVHANHGRLWDAEACGTSQKLRVWESELTPSSSPLPGQNDVPTLLAVPPGTFKAGDRVMLGETVVKLVSVTGVASMKDGRTWDAEVGEPGRKLRVCESEITLLPGQRVGDVLTEHSQPGAVVGREHATYRLNKLEGDSWSMWHPHDQTVPLTYVSRAGWTDFRILSIPAPKADQPVEALDTTSKLEVGDPVRIIGPSLGGHTDRQGEKTFVHVVGDSGKIFVPMEHGKNGVGYPRASLAKLPAPAPAPVEKVEAAATAEQSSVVGEWTVIRDGSYYYVNHAGGRFAGNINRAVCETVANAHNADTSKLRDENARLRAELAAAREGVPDLGIDPEIGGPLTILKLTEVGYYVDNTHCFECINKFWRDDNRSGWSSFGAETALAAWQQCADHYRADRAQAKPAQD